VRRAASTLAFLMSAVIVTFAGCATGHVVVGPDGGAAIEVRCHHNQGHCAAKADRICAGRYQVLDNGVRPQTVVMPNGTVATMQPVFHGYMIIRCQ